MSNLKPETREKLKNVSTRDADDRALQARPAQPVHPGRASAQPDAAPMVGEAFTLRYMPAREDLNPIDRFRTATIRSARRSSNARRAR